MVEVSDNEEESEEMEEEVEGEENQPEDRNAETEKPEPEQPVQPRRRAFADLYDESDRYWNAQMESEARARLQAQDYEIHFEELEVGERLTNTRRTLVQRWQREFDKLLRRLQEGGEEEEAKPVQEAVKQEENGDGLEGSSEKPILIDGSDKETEDVEEVNEVATRASQISIESDQEEVQAEVEQYTIGQRRRRGSSEENFRPDLPTLTRHRLH